MLSQKLQQKLLQKLSPQQILLMKLLQVPSIALEQRIKQEIIENPALEEVDDEYDDDIRIDTEADNENIDSADKDNEEFDITDYIDEDDVPAYKLNSQNNSSDDAYSFMQLNSGITFHENLSAQLQLRNLNEHQMVVANFIIGSLDDSGYLNRELSSLVDDLAFTQGIETNIEELEQMLKVIQEFDPIGVGARDLKECLQIQLKHKQYSESIADALVIVEQFFEELRKKHYDRIIKKGKLTEYQLKEALNEITKLNPKPGNSLNETSKTNQYILPDFFIYNKNDKLELQLNSKNEPQLKISQTYSDMLETYSESKIKNNDQKDAITFIKQKIDSAKWFIDAIKQRHNTLFQTMNAIMEYQEEYFKTGDETKLKPMILKDIADKINLDISTISRVANSKYVQTPFGTMLLKSFFSESLQTDEGDEVSTRKIKKILSDLIENEDKSSPLTDDQLTVIFKEKGYNIARRTVAKYREQLNIQVARLRKVF